MARVEIYTRGWCGYCHQAKSLLKSKGVDFTEIKVNSSNIAEMMERSGGRRTVPQVFIDGRHIGGADDLLALDRSGGLDPLLGRSDSAH